MAGLYTQSDFRAGLLRREAAVATAWPTLALTELPAGPSSEGWTCLGEGGTGGELPSGGIGGELPSGRKRTSPGGEIWQLSFGKLFCSGLAKFLLDAVASDKPSSRANTSQFFMMKFKQSLGYSPSAPAASNCEFGLFLMKVLTVDRS